MKCINKDCNSRICITKKSKYWQTKICKCKIKYNIRNFKDGFSNLYFVHNIRDYEIIGSIGTNNSSFRKIYKKNSNNITLIEYDVDNKPVLNSKNIHRKLKQDLNFCIKYIDNLVFL